MSFRGIIVHFTIAPYRYGVLTPHVLPMFDDMSMSNTVIYLVRGTPAAFLYSLEIRIIFVRRRISCATARPIAADYAVALDMNKRACKKIIFAGSTHFSLFL